MILSAYERKGYAKLLRPEEMVRFNVRPSHTGFTPGRSTDEPAQTVMLQPTTEAPQRFPAARAVRFVVRRFGVRLIPVVGWGLLAKDIYDIVTN
jgi:hypothetical protein